MFSNQDGDWPACATEIKSSLASSGGEMAWPQPWPGTTEPISSNFLVNQSVAWSHAPPAGYQFYEKFPRRSWLSPEIIAGIVVAFDFCLVTVAAVTAFVVYFVASGEPKPESGHYILTSVFAATLFVNGFERLGGYRLKQLVRLRWQLTHVLTVWASAVSLLLLVAFFAKILESYSRGWALASIIAAVCLLSAGRPILHLALARWVRNGSLARIIAIVGAGNEGQRLIRKLQQSRDPSVAVCGVFDDRETGLPPSICGLNILGTTDDLIRFARRNSVDQVIVALPLDAEDQIKTLFEKLKGVAVDIRLSVEPMAERFQIRGMSVVGDVPLLKIADRPLKHWRSVAKWIEDKMLAGILLIWFAPIFALIALAVKLDSRGPVFFSQRRFGFNNGVIRVLKFRTMYIDRCDHSGALRTVRDDPRVTRVGRVLRWQSLDELPQLVNVLRGDMSLVGPRPHAIAMKAGDRLYCDAVEGYLHRHRVKPGITGWAQVNGLRGEIDTLEKARARVAHDLYYIEQWSPWFDVKILLKTIGILASRKNAY
jgi:Undecaprenyl-phosphate glucose phosphotransferase